MALDTKIRIKRNPYHGFEVWVWGDGKLTRRTFADSIDLSAKLLAEKYDKHIAEAACDMLDELEWQEPEYPLGVSYRPSAPPEYDPQSVAFNRLDDCDCELCRGFPAPVAPSNSLLKWTVAFLTLVVGWLVYRRFD